ncbi:MAG: magnesium transporter [Clostridia bacterium]|nr:magnesium transporter [Clostridia bacterium]
MPKLPEEVFANVFIKLPEDLQKYLTDNISDIEFEAVAEELLDDNVEDNVSTEVLNEILLKADADVRHEKLLEIIDGLENKKFATLKPLLKEMDPVDIADVMSDISEENVAVLFRLLPKDTASDVFVNMDNDSQQVLVKSFTDKELGFIINDLFVDDTVDIIEEMPSNVVKRILKLSNAETREQVNKLLGFPKDSAGSIMTTELVTLREKMRVDEALKKIRKQALDKETIYTCYVTDDEKHLLGTVSLRDLIIHAPTEKVSSFMNENFVSAHTHDDKEEVANLLKKYDLLAVPIVDSENRINGIVTVDDAIDVLQDEATEDMSMINGVTPTTKPYLQTSVWKIFLSRMPWLLLLLVSATFTGLIINTYETTLNDLSPLLFACVPMLMDSGGNAGSQASVTIIRSLALDELSPRDVFKVIWKEIRVAIILAAVLAVACFAKLQLIDRLIFGYDYTIVISLVVSLSLFVTICIAKLVGACLPLLAKRFKLDPAVVASPFITTIVDAISLILFCQIAIVLL